MNTTIHTHAPAATHEKGNSSAGIGEKNTDAEASKCVNIVRVGIQRVGCLFITPILRTVANLFNSA